MLSHQPWHEFFWHSLQDLSLEGKNLLDMRAGMGILSIMAARLGAKVTAVESLPDLVRVLRGCAARNDVEDLVRVVSEIRKRPVRKRKSGAPVDVIVSENFSGATLLGEGFLQEHVKQLAISVESCQADFSQNLSPDPANYTAFPPQLLLCFVPVLRHVPSSCFVS